MKKALVLGGEGALGKACREVLEGLGFQVLFTTRKSREEAEALYFDAETFEGWPRILQAGPVQLAVWAIGWVQPRAWVFEELASLEKTIRINLLAPMLLIQSAKRLIEPGGAILLVSSTSGIEARPGWGAYCVAKAGLIRLAESAHLELHPHGIRVYCFVLGRMHSKLREVLAPGEDYSRIMQPGEVANLLHIIIEDQRGLLAGRPIFVRGPS